jgi:hypothetical protein
MDTGVIWIPIVAITGSFVMVVMVVWIATRGRERRARYKADVQMKLIERFGSSTELVNFLQSSSGQQFLEQPQRMTRDRAVGAITGGLVCTFLGAAFIACVFALRDDGFWVPGLLLLGVGIALFISASISLRMARQNRVQAPGTEP